MSEMALTASRKARLQVMVEAGEAGAQAAMDLHDNPTQVPVDGADRHHLDRHPQRHRRRRGVLGAAGGLAARRPSACTTRAADISATALVVMIITFLTIIFGELVPKRIGQMYPETVARLRGAADGVAVDRDAALRVAAVGRAPRRILRLLGMRDGAEPQRHRRGNRRQPRGGRWTPA